MDAARYCSSLQMEIGNDVWDLTVIMGPVWKEDLSAIAQVSIATTSAALLSHQAGNLMSSLQNSRGKHESLGEPLLPQPIYVAIDSLCLYIYICL